MHGLPMGYPWVVDPAHGREMGSTLVPMGLWVRVMGRGLYPMGTHAEVYPHPNPCGYNMDILLLSALG
jgi:hypothetical protein